MKLHLLDDVILNFYFFTSFHKSGTRPNFSKSYHLFTNQNKIIKNRVQKIGGIPLTRRKKKYRAYSFDAKQLTRNSMIEKWIFTFSYKIFCQTYTRENKRGLCRLKEYVKISVRPSIKSAS